MTRETHLLAADARQGLFDEIKRDDGASVATRFEAGRAIGIIARLSDELAAVELDVTHLLHAIDRGYFGEDNCIKDSAFIECLRKYAAPGFDPVKEEHSE